MKFLERVLAVMYLLGIYFAVISRPADPTILFISAIGFGGLYGCCMPFLLEGIHLKSLFSASHRPQLGWMKIVVGILFGLLSAYILFSIAYHQLGKMDDLAIIENCGLLLLMFALVAIVMYRRKKELYYRNILLREVLLAAAIGGSFLLKML